MDKVGGTIVTVDIGTSSIVIIISKVNKFNKLEVIHVEVNPIEQLKKGEILEPYKIADVLKKMLVNIEEECGIIIKSAYVNIPNKYITISENDTCVDIDQNLKVVQQYDVDKLFNTIKNMDIKSSQKIIDVIPIEYTNDFGDVLINPIQAKTLKLNLKSHVVIAEKYYIEKIEAIMQYVKLKVDGYILQSVANSKLALTPEQTNLGVLLIDVGGSTIDLSVYYMNRLIGIEHLDCGGYNVSNDIAIVLDTTFDEGEKLKMQYPLAMDKFIQNNIDVTYVNNLGEKVKVESLTIVQIIQARCSEIFDMINEKLDNLGIKKYINEVVIIGNGFNKLNKIDI
ncbi:MAG: cell division protein FtsA, partial [Clostridia bacterium]|nr:cell division protein FtsA [Clostridia bacterium]